MNIYQILKINKDNMDRTINLNVLIYLVQKLEHRARRIKKKKAKYLQHENTILKSIFIFMEEIENDLLQAASVIKNLINANQKYENIDLNKVFSNTNNNIRRTFSDYNKNPYYNKEETKPQIKLNFKDKHLKDLKTNKKELISKSSSPNKSTNSGSNIILNINKNSSQFKQETKKFVSNSNMHLETDDINKNIMYTEWNKQEKKNETNRYKNKCTNKKNEKLAEKEIKSNKNVKYNSNRNRSAHNKNRICNNKRKDFINYTTPYGRYFTIYKSTDVN